MKKLILLILFLINLGQRLFAQDPVQLPTFNFFDSASHKITGFKFDDELKYKFAVSIGDSEEVFVLQINTLETFSNNFLVAYKKLAGTEARQDSDVKVQAEKLFFMFMAASKAINQSGQPKAGDLVLNSEVYVTKQLTYRDQKKHRQEARQLLRSSSAIDVKRVCLFWHKYKISSKESVNLPDWKGWISRPQAVSMVVSFKKDSSTRSIEDSIRNDIFVIDSLNNENRSLGDSLQKIKSSVESLTLKNGELSTQENKLRKKMLSDKSRMDSILKNEAYYSNNNIGQLIDKQRSIEGKLIGLEATLLLSLPDTKEPLVNIDTTELYLSRVKQLQLALRALKLYPESEPIDGIYDVEMKDLIKKIQRLNSKIAADGIYGSNTKSLLQAMLNDRFEEINKEIETLKNERKALETVFNSMRGVDALYDSIEVADSIVTKLLNELEKNKTQLNSHRLNLARLEKQKKFVEKELERHNTNLKQREQLKFAHKFKIDSIQLEFKAGFIENIRVTGQLEAAHSIPARRLKFDNSYPFGFSRKSDFQNIMHNENWNLQAYANLYQNPTGESEHFQLRTNQFMYNYIQEHQVGRRDYSPQNSIHTVTFDKTKMSTLTLHKTERSKLFEARVYSDFVGFQKGSENGILQTEVSKDLNILTGRNQVRIASLTIVNFGILSQITPSLTISKIEDDNKALQVRYRDDFTAGVYDPVKYITTLDLRSHENLSVGFDLNSFLLDVPDMKSTFSINHGFRYGRVEILDSTKQAVQGVPTLSGRANQFGVDVFRVMLVRANWHLQTVEDFQFDFNWSLNSMFLRDDRFQQVGKYEDFQNSDMRTAPLSESTYYRIELNAQWNPEGDGKNGKLFFRYRYFWQNEFWRTGFNQAQVGYSFFLTRVLK